MLISLFALAVGQASPATPGDEGSAVARRRAQAVLDRFYEATVACRGSAPAKPTIVTADQESIIRFDHERNAIILFPWQVMGEQTRHDLARVASVGTRGLDAEATYADIFNDLLVAHELGHWIQGQAGAKFDGIKDKRGNFDNWFSELNANEIMVAFWREHSPGGARQAKARLEDYLRGLESTPNPLPPTAGETERQFFNADTMKIVRAGAYGWYQGRLGRLAYAERPKPRFCTLIARWMQSPK